MKCLFKLGLVSEWRFKRETKIFIVATQNQSKKINLVNKRLIDVRKYIDHVFSG